MMKYNYDKYFVNSIFHFVKTKILYVFMSILYGLCQLLYVAFGCIVTTLYKIFINLDNNLIQSV